MIRKHWIYILYLNNCAFRATSHRGGWRGAIDTTEYVTENNIGSYEIVDKIYGQS